MTPTTPAQPQKTGAELRAELIDFAKDTIAASGLPDGWAVGTKSRPIPWTPDTWEFSGVGCFVAAPSELRRFELGLHHDQVGDVFEFAYRIGEHWQGIGYTVGTVVGPITTPAGSHSIKIRAERPQDGSLASGVTAVDGFFTLSFYSECSTDPTLEDIVGPDGYRTWDPVGTPEERRRPNQTTTPAPLPFDDDAGAR